MAPEDNPADDVQPTQAEWEEYESEQEHSDRMHRENDPHIHAIDQPPACPTCGAAMEWESCRECFLDLDDEDDDQGSRPPCRLCHGRGGYHVCTMLGTARHNVALNAARLARGEE